MQRRFLRACAIPLLGVLLSVLVVLSPGCGSEGANVTEDAPPPGALDAAIPFDAPSDEPRIDASTSAHAELAAHWAPVWYHDSDEQNPMADFVVAYDFDGDTRSDNNWENLTRPGIDLSAKFYQSVVETETHWFVLYLNFHPRDWDNDCTRVPFTDTCHENDMEGAMVVLRKDDSKFGAFEVLYTEAHNALHAYTNDTSITAGSTSHLESVRVTFENSSHPELYVESKGHGVCALYHSAGSHCKHSTTGRPPEFGGGDGLVYRYKDGVAQVPKSRNDRDIGYALLDTANTLWTRRNDICDSSCTFDTSMTYEGMTLGRAFDGDTHGDDKANPAWAWEDPDDGNVARGDFFFRPAKAYAEHLKMSGKISQTYLVNPFLPRGSR